MIPMNTITSMKKIPPLYVTLHHEKFEHRSNERLHNYKFSALMYNLRKHASSINFCVGIFPSHSEPKSFADFLDL